VLNVLLWLEKLDYRHAGVSLPDELTSRQNPIGVCKPALRLAFPVGSWAEGDSPLGIPYAVD